MHLPQSHPFHRATPPNAAQFSLTPPLNGGTPSPRLLNSPTPAFYRTLSSPQPSSLQLPPQSTPSLGGACSPCSQGMATPLSAVSNSSASSEGGNMSRSISDSTLRRAALHLNLQHSQQQQQMLQNQQLQQQQPQSLLPSFTSLQQFKV